MLGDKSRKKKRDRWKTSELHLRGLHGSPAREKELLTIFYSVVIRKQARKAVDFRIHERNKNQNTAVSGGSGSRVK